MAAVTGRNGLDHCFVIKASTVSEPKHCDETHRLPRDTRVRLDAADRAMGPLEGRRGEQCRLGRPSRYVSGAHLTIPLRSQSYSVIDTETASTEYSQQRAARQAQRSQISFVGGKGDEDHRHSSASRHDGRPSSSSSSSRQDQRTSSSTQRHGATSHTHRGQHDDHRHHATSQNRYASESSGSSQKIGAGAMERIESLTRDRYYSSSAAAPSSSKRR